MTEIMHPPTDYTLVADEATIRILFDSFARALGFYTGLVAHELQQRDGEQRDCTSYLAGRQNLVREKEQFTTLLSVLGMRPPYFCSYKDDYLEDYFPVRWMATGRLARLLGVPRVASMAENSTPRTDSARDVRALSPSYSPVVPLLRCGCLAATKA